ncbi:MAG: hypothetical protein H7331_02550 [Bacteroidia bacterium]|nr:hypothetical protein [Bacteroidia bacterium]
MKSLTIALFLVSLSIACKKKCNCTEVLDSNKIYLKGSLVLYHDTCWKAENQGRGGIPGDWLQKGNDVWKQCK